MADKSRNLSLYAEDSLFVTPGLALIAGVQYLHASRNRHDRFLLDGNQSGQRNHDLWSPRFGILWDAASDIQFFANVSRRAALARYDAKLLAPPSTHLASSEERQSGK